MRTYRYIPLYYFYWSLYNYAAHAADILTPTTVVQDVDNHRRGLYCRRCYFIRVCWGRSSRIFHFSRWLGQLSTVLTKDESPHTGYTVTPWVVSLTPPSIAHWVGGTSILRLSRTNKHTGFCLLCKSFWWLHVNDWSISIKVASLVQGQCYNSASIYMYNNAEEYGFIWSVPRHNKTQKRRKPVCVHTSVHITILSGVRKFPYINRW